MSSATLKISYSKCSLFTNTGLAQQIVSEQWKIQSGRAVIHSKITYLLFYDHYVVLLLQK